ncbi:MAG: sensor histidine kinase [Lachnospiraceae bacterium]|nr:sensor histidine kinase [Lachnospiraceae bacterium]MDY2612429.1 sensor histidine kinase [Lachnospiraceae bacterium]
MRMVEYVKDKILLLVLHMLCMLLLAGFLHGTGYSKEYICLILLGWLGILGCWFVYGYFNRKCYFQKMKEILDQVDQRYLLGELMPESYRLEDRLYRDMIRRSNKSVIDRIRVVEDQQKDYREYIESWVHEIKAPITSIALMCENHKDNLTRQIHLENQKIENYVDMALYYARSESVYKDYVIQETDFQEIAVVVLNRNKQYLIQNRVQAEVDCKDVAYTDKKWIAFILNQLILNSAKYRKEEGGYIQIRTERYPGGIRLLVIDDGIGIREEDMPRIFEKGFTGSNGRMQERSTGMGLYLCKKLCQNLGIGIYAESEEGKGTKMTLEFPVSSYLSKL